MRFVPAVGFPLPKRLAAAISYPLPPTSMKHKTKRLRRLYTSVYVDARRRTRTRVKHTGVPGPFFDCVVVGLTLVLGILHLL